MKKVFAVLVVCGLLLGCGVHATKHPMAGMWYSTIEKIDVSLELVFGEGTVTGGLKLLDEVDGEIPKGTVLDLMEGTYSNGEVRFYVDIDENGMKSDEDVYMELHLEGKQTLAGLGYEVDDPDDKRELSFRRSL